MKYIITSYFIVAILLLTCSFDRVKTPEIEKIESISKLILEEDKDINLTLKEKIGQLILVMAPGGDQKTLLEEYPITGYILGGNEIENHTKSSLKAEMDSYQSLLKVPMLFAIDEEGGSVTRVSYNKNLYNGFFLSPKTIYQKMGMEGIKRDTEEKSKILEELGFTINLAPVGDVATNPNSYMWYRSVDEDYETASKVVSEVIQTSLDYNVSYAVKHFPGHGDYRDTHLRRIIDKKTLEEYYEKDFLPFQGAIASGAEIIMMDHIVMTSLDEKNPASISKKVIDFLKEKLDYKGLVMTDCLSMIEDEGKYWKAVNAGNDFLIVKDYESAFKEIEDAIAKGLLKEETLDYHVKRVLKWKKDKEIIKEKAE